MFSKSNLSTLFVVSVLILGILLPLHSFTYADTYKCDTPDEKAKCQQLLSQTQAEIDGLSTQLDGIKQTGSSLEKDKQILAIQIKQAQLQIKAHELTIANLGKDIVKKTQVIQQLDTKINTGQESLSQIIRKTNQVDDYSLPEVILGADDLSTAFADLDAFDSIKLSLAGVFTELRDNKKQTEDAKISLDKQKSQELDTKVSIESEKKKVEAASAEKQRLLNINKNTQSDYQKQIADKAAQVSKIKSALFGLRDSAAIPFEDAYKYAKNASKVTGVRAAFVLAIITQESNLGANVGSCYVTNLNTGDGKGKNTGTLFEQVMKAPRDTVPFTSLTSALGRDWSTTPVSCPIGSTSYYVGRGYGGGMGPAQFIPSTWILMEKRLEGALGVSATDPWNPEHAIMASSMYLQDRGAVAGSYSSEIKAACKYYGSGGATCSYGTQVMARVATLQSNIDLIEEN
ncbi:MAG: hypothetical protein JWP09_196 [Candidatus Taylorbacteria bacterium]|nr:hypothetical protein [Candidatus Taylorbacteria bacterium]